MNNMDTNTIRAIIFLVAGLIIILFPNQVYKFQIFVFKKLHIKHSLKNDQKQYGYIGLIFIIISIILLVYLILN